MKALKTIQLCHGWDVLCEVNGKPVTLTFPTEPTTKEIDVRMAEAAQRQEAEAKQVAVDTGIVPGGMSFAALVSVVEQLSTRVADRWKTESKDNAALAKTVDKIAAVVTADKVS